MPRLIIEEGMQKGREFRFTAEASVGRGKDNLVTVEDPRISLRHAKIILENGRYVLKDLASRNGTFINGERVTEQPIHFGDKVKIGAAIFSFAEDPKGKWAGRMLGGYELLDIAGEGGMGTVYKARQISLDRIVALKLMHEPLMKDPQYGERFVAEAKTAATLNHPGIVQIHDVGCENGTYFFSMEYVDGVTLAERIQKGPPLPIEEATGVILRIAEALAYAHAQGIVHRDVKPENILLAAGGEAKLADLGVAKQTLSMETTPSGQAGKRLLTGTPAYIAPEEILGKGTGPASDIYSLGASFYHLLAGRPPFISASPTETLRMHLANTPPDIRRYNPDVPPDLCDIVARMMAKNPADRFPNAQEVADALRQPLRKKSRRASLRSPSSRVAVAGILAVAAIAAVWSLTHRKGSEDSPHGAGAVPGTPETAQSLFNRAAQAHDEKRFDEAETFYRLVIEKDPASLWAVRAEEDLHRLAAERSTREIEALKGRLDRILQETQGAYEKRLDPLTALARDAQRHPAVAQAIEAEIARTRKILDQQKAIKEAERLEKERLSRAFREEADRIKDAERRKDFGAAWRGLEALHASYSKPPWQDDVSTLRKELLDQMNGFLNTRREEWEDLRARARYSAGWALAEDTSKTLANTPLEAQAKLAAQRVASDIKTAFQTEAAPCETLIRAKRFREAAERLRKTAEAYAGTPSEEEALQALQLPQMLSALHAAAVERIRTLPPQERKAVSLEPGRPKTRVANADDSSVTLESIPGPGMPGVQWQKSWEALDPRQIYTIYEAHLDKRRRQTHEWLLAFCTAFELADEAEEHTGKLAGAPR